MLRDYYNVIKYSNISNEDKQELRNFLELLDNDKNESDKLINFNHDKLKNIFEIAKFDSRLQIEIWEALSDDVVDNPKNLEIFEDVLENKFGEYIDGIDKKTLVGLLNSSRYSYIRMDDKGKILYSNVALLEQMNSSLFENPVAKEAFSFEQLLEIISVKDTEKKLELILENSNSRKILTSIGKDSQSWQSKLQYLMNLEIEKRNHIINEFGLDGESLIQDELKRREEGFISMERGWFEDEECGVIDCEIEPRYMLSATFGISCDEAKDLIKKYGIDTDKLNIYGFKKI